MSNRMQPYSHVPCPLFPNLASRRHVSARFLLAVSHLAVSGRERLHAAVFFAACMIYRRSAGYWICNNNFHLLGPQINLRGTLVRCRDTLEYTRVTVTQD